MKKGCAYSNAKIEEINQAEYLVTVVLCPLCGHEISYKYPHLSNLQSMNSTRMPISHQTPRRRVVIFLCEATSSQVFS